MATTERFGIDMLILWLLFSVPAPYPYSAVESNCTAQDDTDAIPNTRGDVYPLPPGT